MTVPMVLCIEHNPKLVPAGGQEVRASPGAPVTLANKEAAGWLFHEAALLLAGVKELKRACPVPPPPVPPR
jgi:hypothetical protein